MVLYDQRGRAEAAEALLRVGHPVVVEGLRAEEGGDGDALRLPDEAQFPGATDCPAYFIFSEKVSVVLGFA